MMRRVRQARQVWQAQGALAVLVAIRNRVRDRLAIVVDEQFDRRHGVETCGNVLMYRADGPPESNPSYFDYQPTPVRTIRYLLRQLGNTVQETTFIDCGSGKGRVILLASELPFRRVIGVEFDQRLHAIANANIAAVRSRMRCPEVESHHGRAEQLSIPSGNLLFYFFHPFDAQILEAIILRILQAHQHSPRTVRLLFFRHSQRAVLERFPAFRLESTVKLPMDIVRSATGYRDRDGNVYDAALYVMHP